MSAENTTTRNLTALREELKAAAYAYAEAYALELDQSSVSGIPKHPELAMGLDISIKDAVNDGALDALMSAQNIRGNQSEAAKVLRINRATLRSRLYRCGLLLQRRKLSDAEQAAYEARGNKSCEATRQRKLPAKVAA